MMNMHWTVIILCLVFPQVHCLITQLASESVPVCCNEIEVNKVEPTCCLPEGFQCDFFSYTPSIAQDLSDFFLNRKVRFFRGIP